MAENIPRIVVAGIPVDDEHQTRFIYIAEIRRQCQEPGLSESPKSPPGRRLSAYAGKLRIMVKVTRHDNSQ
jgi:hypothetical protein